MCRRRFSACRSKPSIVKRRAFLGSAGIVGSVALVGQLSREPVEAIDVRFWRTEGVAASPVTAVRIAEYVDHALDLPFWSVDVSDGGVVSTHIEDGARVTSRGEWPAHLVVGSVRSEGVRPAGDVNVLVTDGELGNGPSGYGLPNVASIGGGSALADLPPIDAQPDAAPLTRPNFVAQVLVHEVGHALGLEHGHGDAVREGDHLIASPMLSAYAWDDEYTHDCGACGSCLPDPSGLDRRLSFTYSDCARRRLREYRGGLIPSRLSGDE